MLASFFIFFPLQIEISYAQSYRDLGPDPLYETFRNLLKNSKNNEFEKLEKSLKLIKPLTQALDSKFSKNSEIVIQNAIDKKDAEKAVQAVQELIFLDINDQILVGIDTAPNFKEQGLSKFKNAYLDYLLLSPSIEEINYSGDQKIRNIFRKFLTFINKSDLLPGVHQDLKKEMISAFPNLKRY